MEAVYLKQLFSNMSSMGTLLFQDGSNIFPAVTTNSVTVLSLATTSYPPSKIRVLTGSLLQKRYCNLIFSHTFVWKSCTMKTSTERRRIAFPSLSVLLLDRDAHQSFPLFSYNSAKLTNAYLNLTETKIFQCLKQFANR